MVFRELWCADLEFRVPIAAVAIELRVDLSRQPDVAFLRAAASAAVRRCMCVFCVSHRPHG